MSELSILANNLAMKVDMDSSLDKNKVIIFDWDDTICPSTFVDRGKVDKYQDLPLHLQQTFDAICECAEKCLTAAANYGEVIIITNADDGWVNYSAGKYLPKLVPFLENVRVVSARSRYEQFYPNQPLCWKAAAFAHEVNEIYSSWSVPVSDDGSTSSDSSASSGSTSSEKRRREVISFGDSTAERTAVKIVSQQLESSPKSVMFLTGPTPMQILGQLSLLATHMAYVCDHTDSLDLEISAQQAMKTAEAFVEGSQSPSDMLEKETFTGVVKSSSKRKPRTLNDIFSIWQKSPGS